MSSEAFGRMLAIVAVTCAVIVTVVIGRRGGPWSPESIPVETILVREDSVRVEDWQRYVVGAETIGMGSGRVKLIVFTDFECPACRRFMAGPVLGARQRFGSELDVLIQHWPLPSHRLARSSAEASLCAAEQGRFETFHDLLFEKQDSIGIKTLSAFAAEAGVPDMRQFDACASNRTYRSVVDSGVVMASDLGGRGTPLIVVNGLVLKTGLDSVGLDRLVAAALDGR